MSRFINKRADTSKPATFGVFESRFDPNGRFLYAMTKTPDGVFRFHRSIKSLFKELTIIPDITWFFHKDSQRDFDFAHLAYQMVEWAEQQGHTVDHRSSGDTILGMILRRPTVIYKPGRRNPSSKNYKAWVIDKHHIEKVIIRNSQPMMALDLNKAIRLFAPQMKVPSVEFDDTTKLNPKNANHMDYLHRKLDGMEAAISGHDRLIYDTWGVHPGWTSAGTARKAWRAGIPEKVTYWRIHNSKEQFIHKAYYSAFLYPGSTTDIHHNSTNVDEGGAYADCMRMGVPYGYPTWTREFKNDRPGFYEVYAEAPGTSWPLVPFKDGRGWMHWTDQSCTTYLSDIEIRWYAERGWRFFVNEGVFFDRIVFPFNEFVDKCESLEYPNGKNSDPAVKETVKSMRTRLYGSLALKEDQEMVTFKAVTDDVIREMVGVGYPLINKTTGEQLPAWVITKKVDADYINTHWAAYITARQRLKLFDAMELVGLENVHYGDTDNINGDRDAIRKAFPMLNHRVGYGSWSIKAEYEWFQVDAPKALHGKYTDEWAASQNMDTPFFGQEPGVPKVVLALHPEYYLDNVPLRFNTVKGLKHALEYPDDPIVAEKERSMSPFRSNSAWMTLRDHSIVPRPIDNHHPHFDGTPVVFDARYAVKWLRELGLSNPEVAKGLGVSMSVIHNIVKGHNSGAKYLDQLINMIRCQLDDARNAGLVIKNAL